ncbi:golgi uridine diphosphate-N- acetylglucosamine transporter [Beauveria asiatica]|uniref:Golgi uridine diphosphate-N- acetylglucosamine transporter n=1 Tax=Beauveria asiatica TaxID=1069075 RepID=A0AAW0RTV2_9HYPO
MGDARYLHDAENGVQKFSTKNNDIPVSAASNVGLSAVAALAMLGLVFGGCCSNVYALESIINFESGSGTFLTFIQFLFVAITGYMSQFDSKRPPFFLAPTKVPFTRWAVNIILFFAINVLNNHAFSYDISVPVHIIIRSGGSLTTMVAGYFYGKRYSKTQIMSVILLSIGVIQAAWSDASAKSKPKNSSEPAFGTGLVMLFVAQVLSAIMGLYTEATSQPMILYHSFGLRIPSQLVNVASNILTQYACIRGVNLLAAASSALTVTIVLNIRKLVSLLLSIWLFDNTLAVGTVIGALLVFGGGAIYTLDSKTNLAKSSSENAGSKKKN